VRPADLEHGVFDQYGRQRGRRTYLVVIVVENPGRQIKPAEVTVRSVSENVLMQKYDAGKPAIMPGGQNESRTPS
jgi:hypothetical protein